jgi:hypothetical protein
MRVLLAALLAGLVIAAPAAAQLGPLNDLEALGQGEGQLPVRLIAQHNPEPALTPTPLAPCGAGARREPGVDGRVPAGSATKGLNCNVTEIAHQGTSGGFKTLRYVDTHGHECAFYDTALLFPLNVFNLNSSGLGVAVLDMSDPAHPKQTDTLTEFPMLSPHESVVVNQKRGLLAAVSGNPATEPGDVSIYDASQDCRHPVLDFTGLIARLGHESGFSPDGKTFYAAATGATSITAIDVTDPKAPHPIWQGQVLSHGMSISDDGDRAYIADALGGDMLILDTSQIQARKPNPQAREISRLTWKSASIPQNAIPFTEHGHPYVLEFDEYTAGTTGGGSKDDVGAARIIDIADETRPRVIANLRLAIDQPAAHAAAAADPGAFSPVQGYAAHYCNIPSRVDPKVVACSFIASGLRVFDISKLTAPKEIGYFVAPTVSKVENATQASDFAMSQPAIIPKRREIWYTDGTSGFYVVRVAQSVWPTAEVTTHHVSVRRRCASRRRFGVRVRLPRGARVRSVSARLGAKRVTGVQRGRYVRLIADLRGKAKRVVKLRVRVTLTNGGVIRDIRTYHPCTSRA